MTQGATQATLRALAGPLRGWRRAVWGMAVLATLGWVLGTAAWMARAGLATQPYWSLLAWAVAALAIGGLAVLGWRRRTSLSEAALARRLEAGPPWRIGAISGLLAPAAAGTSASLHALADKQEADVLARSGADALAPLLSRLRRQAAAGGLVLCGGLLLLAAAGPIRGVASALWHPAAAWEATVAPLRVGVSASSVNRGDSVDVLISARGRHAVTLWTRAPGEAWRPMEVAVDSVGATAVNSGPLTSDLFARITSGRRISDTVAVKVRLPAFLGSVELVAQYPSYLGLEDEPLPVGGDTLLLPAGTVVAVRGEATAELVAASWFVSGASTGMEVAGTRFHGRLLPSASGDYRLHLTTASGAPLAGDSVVVPIRVIPDAAPTVEIPVPGMDTIAPLSLRFPLVIDVRDDYGLARATLMARRINRLGLEDTLPSAPLGLPEGRTDRAIVSHEFDLNGMGLLPGDTVRYLVEAVDNSPRGQRARSREYVVRLPTMSEVRAAAREASEAVAGRLDSLSESSKDLERETEDLSRERTRKDNTTSGTREQALSFENAKRAEAAANEQEELIAQAEQLRDAMQSLEQLTNEAGINDPAWQHDLEEIRKQLDRALSPELKARLDELRRALQDLDADRTREALERLAEAQRELREALERSKELFRRAALEGDLANLQDEAEELTQEQKGWNESAPVADSAAAAALEKAMAQRADSLAAALDRLGEDLAGEREAAAMEELAQQARAAAERMKAAQSSMQQGNRGQAQQQGRQALQQMQPLSQGLDQARNAMQERWRQEVVQALDQALAETSRLVDRQLAVEQRARQGGSASEQRGEQGAVQEGVERLVQRMQDLSGRNALVSPQIAGALVQAERAMSESREALSSAVPNQREAADRAGEAADILNSAAYQMLRSRGDVSGAGSGSGLAEALEQMSQMAQQQGQLSQQSGSLLPMMGQSGVRQELRRLSEDQRRLAEELERLQAQGNLPPAGPLAQEARELSRRLEAGRLDRETVRRQEQLFRRMLDAGRTLQGQEKDEKKERKSEAPKTDEVRLPPALRARILDDRDRPRLPTWDELQQFTPEERRLVVDYFRRLSQRTAP